MTDSKQTSAGFRYPKLWIGYLTGGVTFVMFLALALLKPDAKTPYTLVTGLLAMVMVTALLTGIVYWFMAVYRLHKILLEATGQKYPISAGRAVGFQFIPFYNIYWMFKWPGEIAAFVNHVQDKKVMGKNRYGWMLILAGIVGRFFTGTFILISFLVLGELCQGVREALEGRALPVETYDKETYKSQAAVILLWVFFGVFFFGLLAAIAIPNFIKARDAARAARAQNTMAGPTASATP